MLQRKRRGRADDPHDEEDDKPGAEEFRPRWGGGGRREVAILVLLVLAAIPVSGALRGRNSSVGPTHIPTAQVQSGPVTIKVTEAGELKARDQVTISAPNDKQIRWLMPEGTYVRQGDTLVVFESEKYLISTGEAQSSLAVEEANLAQARNELQAQK